MGKMEKLQGIKKELEEIAAEEYDSSDCNEKMLYELEEAIKHVRRTIIKIIEENNNKQIRKGE